MRQRLRYILIAAVAALLNAGPAEAGSSFIVRTTSLTADGITARHGLAGVRPVDDAGRGLFIVSAPDGVPVDQFESEMDADPDVAGCEPNRNALLPEHPKVLQAGLAQSTAHILDAIQNRTNVFYYGSRVWNAYLNQPAALLVRVGPAHNDFATGAGIVAIIDTGVDPKHPALAQVLVPGYDFIRDVPGIPSELADLDQSTAHILDQSTAHILDGWAVTTLSGTTAAVLDQSTAHILDGSQLPSAFGHGTMVAGVVHLVAPTASIMPLKAFRADGTTDLFTILRAIYYAADHGARVLNMSFSIPEASPELVTAVNYAINRGVTCVSSAGNAGRETLVYPAAFKNVIGVASTTTLDVRSTFSNFGSGLVDIAAPGEEIVTTYPGGYWAAASGTSFSTPFVAGGAALLVDLKATIAPFDVADSLSHGAKVPANIGRTRLDLVPALATRAK